MRQEVKKGTGFVYYSSNLDLLNHIEEYHREHGLTPIADDLSHGRRVSWAGANWSTSKENLIYGNPKATFDIIDGLTSLSAETESNCGIFMDTEGFAYDMGAVVSGEPECCLNSGSVSNKKYVNIVFDLTAPCHTESKILHNRGVGVASLINTLITQGVIVNLKIVYYVSLSYEAKMLDKDIGKLAMYLDVPCENLSIATIGTYCSPEFFRAIMITAEGINTGDPTSEGEAQGIYPSCLSDDDFYIPSFYIDLEQRKLDTPEKGIEYINKIFNKWAKEKNHDTV